MSYSTGPARTVVTGWQRNENDVTMPKLPPPPRNAQKSSGLPLGVGLDDRAVREDDRRRHEVVDREPHPPRQVSHAAAERQPADAGGADDPDGDGQPVLVRGVEQVLEQRAASDARQLRAARRPRSRSSARDRSRARRRPSRGRRRCVRRRARRSAGRARRRSARLRRRPPRRRSTRSRPAACRSSPL